MEKAGAQVVLLFGTGNCLEVHGMTDWLQPALAWTFAAATVLAMFTLLIAVSLYEQRRESRRRNLRLLAENEARLQLALWGSGEWLWEYRVVSGRLTCAELMRQFGRSWRKGLPLGVLVRRFVHPGDQAGISRFRNEFEGGLRELNLKVRIRVAEDDYRWLRWRGKVAVVDTEGRALLVTGTCKDISAEHEAESQLRLGSQVMESVSDAIIVIDTGFRMIRVNRSFFEISGYDASQVIGEPIAMLSAAEDRDVFEQSVRPALLSAGAWEGENWQVHRNGQRYLARGRITSMAGDDGNVAYYVAMFADITRRKEFEEKLHFLANYDPMTGLLNRSALVERLQQAINHARILNRAVAVLFLDLDHFKQVNDSFGHAVGDDVLRAAAGRISMTLRVEDVVARFGGDEFVILLDRIGSRENVERVATKLLAAFQNELEISNHAFTVTPSIGISLFPEDGTSSQELLEHADTAMYQAKKRRPSSYSFYEGAMSTIARDELKRENQLRRALDQQQLCLHYQPIVDSADGTVTGVEALLRWRNPESGFLMPGSFIRLAEERGLINEIGAWVLRQAAVDITNLNRRLRQRLYVSVNVSSIQVRDAGFLACVGRALAESGLNPQLLHLELTESLIMDASQQVLQVLHELRSQGIRLALDDFGTGYSSLSYLRRFPISDLKIDKSFVRDIPQDSEAESIVTTIIALGHAMNMGVTAEGVETLAQSRFLEHQGCLEQQGFYFAEPGELADIEQALIPGASLLPGNRRVAGHS